MTVQLCYGWEMENVFYPHLASLIPDRNLWVGPSDSVQHFLRWPTEYRIFLQLLCGATSNSNYLEIGCNHGRTALGLVDLISEKGSYTGFDILKEHVDFAQNYFPLANGRMRFIYADLYNQVYNPTGTIDPLEYLFPAASEKIDVAFAASVFTHLLPATVEHYFAETERVLSSGGKALYSFFVLDNYIGPGKSAHDLYEFEYKLTDYPGVSVRFEDRPEAVIAYSLDAIEKMARAKGLKIESIIYGYWSLQHADAAHEQDLIVLSKV